MLIIGFCFGGREDEFFLVFGGGNGGVLCLELEWGKLEEVVLCISVVGCFSVFFGFGFDDGVKLVVMLGSDVGVVGV